MKKLMVVALVWLALVLAHSARAGTVTYVYSDPQGTPLAEADASGNVTATFDYRPYGAQALGSPKDGPGYTGHVNDADSGFVYMQARYYDPTIVRFLSVDPISLDAGGLLKLNRYDYGNNNPVKNIDPDGRQEEDAEARAEDTRATMEMLRPDLGPNISTASPFEMLPGESSEGFAVRQAERFAEMCAAPGQKVDLASVSRAAASNVESLTPKTFQTYIKVNPTTGEIYSGRTSGRGTPEENIASRDAGHHMNEKGFGPAILDRSSPNPDAIRGREQQLIEGNGGAQSQGGSSGNAINGVSPRNTNSQTYRKAADDPRNFEY